MFGRTKNHACVVAWSLGNESGYGPNFEACAAWLRAANAKSLPRWLQYEGGRDSVGGLVHFQGNGKGAVSDVVCPMYHEPEEILDTALGAETRPIILCEYAHMMENSGGGLDLYFELFDSQDSAHRQIQGGFIWDWADLTVLRS